jgi:hypothetical protein
VKNVEKASKSQNSPLNYRSLIEKITENGDLCVLGMKGTCKTTLLMQLARTIRAEQSNHLIIFETFPKWIKEFDSIPFLTISDNDVQQKENLPFLEDDKSYIQWSKDYSILNAGAILEFLKTNKDVIFLIECEDMEKISAFMTFVIYSIYRKQYLRAKAECLDKVNESFWFLCEEAHNLMDSTVLAKKTFNRLRKMQAEFRNLKMHLIVVTLRLQSLSPKIRSTMPILCSRVSLDDYQLKVRNLLKSSAFRDTITELPKGEFIFPETDQKLTVEPFKQNGTPYEIKKKLPEQSKPKMGFLKALMISITEGSASYIKRHPELYNKEQIQQAENKENLDDTESELDLTMTTEEPIDNTCMFPTEEQLNPSLFKE